MLGYGQIGQPKLAKKVVEIYRSSYMPFRIGPTDIILLLPVLAFYFLPSIIALVRHRTNTLWIFLLNFLLGWSIIGWIGALVWSIIDRQKEIEDI